MRYLGASKLFASAVILFIFAGCTGSNLEKTVKSGTLDIDKSVTVGDALNGYKYFGKDKEWSTLVDSQGRQVVQFRGEIDFDKFIDASSEGITVTEDMLKKMKDNMNQIQSTISLTYVVQFCLNKGDSDSKFGVQYSGLEFKMENMKTGETKNQDAPDEDGTYLKSVYTNQPTIGIAYILLFSQMEVEKQAEAKKQSSAASNTIDIAPSGKENIEPQHVTAGTQHSSPPSPPSTSAIASTSFVPQKMSLAGTINGKLRIQMTLQAEGNNLKGKYFYESQKKDIALSGTVDNERNITLSESDTLGNPTGSFKGKFVSEGRVEGQWSNVDSSKSFPFVLEMTPSSPEESAGPDKGGTPGKWTTGKWDRVGRGESDAATLEITSVSGDSFGFSISAASGQNAGELSGTANIKQDVAVFSDPDSGCTTTFTQQGNSIHVETTGDCSGFGGIGVFFFGEYSPQK